MKFYSRLRILKVSLQLILNPKRTDLIFKAVQIISEDPDHEVFAAIEKKFEHNRDFWAMFSERYNPKPPTVAELSVFPEGSFGKALYHHLHTNKLSLEIFPRFECSRPIEYLSLRVYQDHDLWHVLTGYGINLEDELALQAFGVAQFHSPIATLLVAGGLLHLIWKSPLKAVEALGQVSLGYQRGLQARSLMGIRLHDLFDRPLPEVQKLCGLAPYGEINSSEYSQGLPLMVAALQH